MVAVPARHPVLAFKKIPLVEVLRYPLVLGDPVICEGTLARLTAFCECRYKNHWLLNA